MLKFTVWQPQITAVCWVRVRAAAAAWVQTVQTDHQPLKKSCPLWAGQLFITESQQSVSHPQSHLFLSACLSAHRSVCLYPLICWWLSFSYCVSFILAASSSPHFSLTDIKFTSRYINLFGRLTPPKKKLDYPRMQLILFCIRVSFIECHSWQSGDLLHLFILTSNLICSPCTNLLLSLIQPSHSLWEIQFSSKARLHMSSTHSRSHSHTC